MAQARNSYAAGESETRPWGSWAVLDTGETYAVKRIVVRPGHRLSLQRHQHRAEHWLIVAGSGLVTRNEESFALGPGEAVDIAVGDIHRIANPGTADLVFIEIQTGPILSEDDIERFQDDYKRSS
jgi:mannose-6-phosphate isomerase-like protein (cupin superfamily)